MNSAVAQLFVKHAITGGLVGVLGFVIFNGFYLKMFFRAIAANKAIGLEPLKAMTTHSPYYWSVLILMVSLCALIGYIMPIAVSPDGFPR